MPVHNADIAAIFAEIADLQEILGENPFRIRAYRNAARVISGLGHELREMIDAGTDLTEIDGIGADLAKKIQTIMVSGTVDTLEKLRGQLPPGITDLLRVQGLGPKRLKQLLSDLQIQNRAELERACIEQKVRMLRGFGEKVEAAILHSLQHQAVQDQRFLRANVMPCVECLVSGLREVPGVRDVAVAGSYRRGQETVGDIDILCSAASGSDVMSRLVASEDVKDIIAHGSTKSSVRLRSGLQVDVRVVPQESWGAALLYFTGSKAVNIVMRKRAQERSLKLNEYGLFNEKAEEPGSEDASLAGKTEDEIFKALELRGIPPELREDRGEIAAALEDKLPHLVVPSDIRGDLHGHSDWSDGELTIEEVARTAKDRGYEYIAITDHSKRLTVANGLTPERLVRQLEEVDRVNHLVRGIRLLKGLEADVLEDGTLDMPDEILARLDVVVASVHHKFNLPEDRQTARVMKAMDNPYVTIIAHPTGRLLPDRPPYAINIPKIIEHAAKRGVALELNASPMRLDLDDKYCRMCKEAGVLVSIDSDSHKAADYDNMRHGIMQARRAWLEATDVLNARRLPELLEILQRRRG